MPGAEMLVHSGRVVAVGPRCAANAGADVRRLDAGGRWLLPGLIDLHVHLDEVITPGAFPLFGVTSVRDCGSRLVTMQKLHARAARGEGMPRLFWLGRNIDETTPSWSGAVAVAGPAQVPALLDDMGRQGVDGAKLYVNARADVGAAVIDGAHRRGWPVTGHLDALDPAVAADLGIDGLEHAFTLFSAGICHTDAKHAAGMRKPYAGAGDVDLDAPPARRMVAALARAGRRPVTLTATLTVSVMPLLSEREVASVYAGWADVPPGWRTYWKDAYWSFLQPAGWTGADLRTAARANRAFVAMVRRLDAAGVPIGAGTDTPAPGVLPGAGLVRELELLVAAGLPPRTALLGATGHAAAALRRVGIVGTLTPGARADFILVDGNPLDDIRAMRRLGAVYQNGAEVDRKALRAAFDSVAAPPPQKPAA
jgi:imidazolonepropionase-like amidohydrolase